MIESMTLVRKTVTLPEDVVRGVEELSDGNFSAFTADMLARAVRRSHLRAVVAEIEAEIGPVTEAERAAARAEYHAARADIRAAQAELRGE